MGTIIKRKLAWMLTGILVAGMLAGCGQRPSRQRKGSAEEDAAGQKEREASQLSELIQEKGLLMHVTNDSIFVSDRYKDNGDYFNCIMQYSRQGEKKHRYSLGEMEVEGISGDLICYSEEKYGEDREILYVAPIEKEDKEERVILDKRKKIGESELEGIYDSYVWKSHVYYVSDGDGVYHYDAGTEETECILRFQKDDGAAFGAVCKDDVLEGADAGQKIFLTASDTCYLLDLEKGKIEHVQLKGMNLNTGEVRDIPEDDVVYQVFTLSEEVDWSEAAMETTCYYSRQ